MPKLAQRAEKHSNALEKHSKRGGARPRSGPKPTLGRARLAVLARAVAKRFYGGNQSAACRYIAQADARLAHRARRALADLAHEYLPDDVAAASGLPSGPCIKCGKAVYAVAVEAPNAVVIPHEVGGEPALLVLAPPDPPKVLRGVEPYTPPPAGAPGCGFLCATCRP